VSSAAKKRFKITGTGKITKRKAFRVHKLEHKSSARTRRLGRPNELEGGDKRMVERLLRLR
jgi:large subunit ribosomal protein L35